ncbi:O-6-methylguanine DNA methyltransferase [Syntrophus gentianae]|uniref:methylated-DNA--[protein]-cysteine S-methyltransferase n=1 Tax=Syntrophus gentianae TaxID=43775 RepID=A0A1H7WGG2_9BACT|nr:methylated-DNA--[protein]-cysteine S-methyltransferase [Syntrophus gentianae]SEM19967.1 O-6-methylguanine DNA methyltransferase [Syntrophus gentianae]
MKQARSISPAFCLRDTPFGPVAVLWSVYRNEPKICRVLLSHPENPAGDSVKKIFPDSELASSSTMNPVLDQIEAFLSGEDVRFSIDRLCLDLCSAFQRSVLLADYAIPRGLVSTYKLIAKHLANPKGARAVGTALANNPFPLIIPCHRVLRSDGGLGGFQYGLKMKRALLEMEGIAFRDEEHVVMQDFFYGDQSGKAERKEQRGKQSMDEMLNAQQQHWENTLSETEEMFGAEPSEPARVAAELFQKEGKKRILELGGGQGRDTLFFAGKGFSVDVLDYTEQSLTTIVKKARQSGLSDRVAAIRHDVRKPLPFRDETFDACYSHMLYCMALTTAELEQLSSEIHRVLRPDGLNLYTVRSTGDAHYGAGVSRGEDLYEVAGFIVHFFNREKIKQLAKGYDLIGIEAFEEGPLPRKLFRVTMRKRVK